MKLPGPVPELPVSDIQAAVKAYTSQMGFNVDWMYEDTFAGISKDSARIFLRRRTPKETVQRYAVTVWLNMESPADVGELHLAWKDRGVHIVEDPHTAPYNLREFTAQDFDGNRFRVFYDLGGART